MHTAHQGTRRLSKPESVDNALEILVGAYGPSTAPQLIVGSSRTAAHEFLLEGLRRPPPVTHQSRWFQLPRRSLPKKASLPAAMGRRGCRWFGFLLATDGEFQLELGGIWLRVQVLEFDWNRPVGCFSSVKSPRFFDNDPFVWSYWRLRLDRWVSLVFNTQL